MTHTNTPPAVPEGTFDVREARTRSLTGGERLTPDEAMQHAYAIAVTRAPGRMTWGEALRHFATWMREHDSRLVVEVRPPEAITDAEVEAAARVIYEKDASIYGWTERFDDTHRSTRIRYYNVARAALEASRKVCP